MSANSHKQRYDQLMTWLSTRPSKEGKGPAKKESRLDYYKKRGN